MFLRALSGIYGKLRSVGVDGAQRSVELCADMLCQRTNPKEDAMPTRPYVNPPRVLIWTTVAQNIDNNAVE